MTRTTSGRRRRRRRLALLLGLVLLLAAGLRIAGCFGQGYPFSFYPDEDGSIRRVMRLGHERTLDLGDFSKPGLGFYVLLGEYMAYYGIGRLAGWFETPEDFGIHYLNDQGPFLLIGRISTALFGVLTVLLTYRLGKAVGGRRVGLFAALLLALTFGHVAAGQHVKVDVPAAFFTTWAMVATVGILELGRRRDYAASGVLAGLGFATKYYPTVLAPFLFAHLFRGRRARAGSPGTILSSRLWLGGLAFFAGFFVGSPYNFLNPSFFKDKVIPILNFIFGRFGIRLGQAGEPPAKEAIFDPERVGIPESVWLHLKMLADPETCGPVLLVLVIAGFAAILRSRRRREVLVLVGVLGYVLIAGVGNRQIPHPRHLTSLYPLLAVMGALGAVRLTDAVAIRLRRSPALPAAAIATAVLLPIAGFPVAAIVDHDRAQLAPRAELAAIRWIEANVPPGSTIMIEHDLIKLRPTHGRSTWALQKLQSLSKRPGGLAGIHGTQIALWQLEQRAIRYARVPLYDYAVMEHTWQTHDFMKRVSAGTAYNPLWLKSPWSHRMYAVLRSFEAEEPPSDPEPETWRRLRGQLPPKERDLPPVELWAQPTSLARPFLVWETDDEGHRRLTHGIQWWVTARAWVDPASWDPATRPWRRANYPDFSVFYDDLRAHYDCYELEDAGGDDQRTVRIYDLRRRVTDREPRCTTVR